MAVPDVQTMIRPALVVLSDGVPHPVRYIRDALALELDVSDADMEVLLPSGKQTAYANRVGWVLVYLGRAGLVTREGRGLYAITEGGVTALHRYPDRIDLATLRAYPSFAEFRNRPVHAATGASTSNALYPDFDGAGLHGSSGASTGYLNGHAPSMSHAAYNGANGHGSLNGHAPEAAVLNGSSANGYGAVNGYRHDEPPAQAQHDAGTRHAAPAYAEASGAQHAAANPYRDPRAYEPTTTASVGPNAGPHGTPVQSIQFEAHAECCCGHGHAHAASASTDATAHETATTQQTPAWQQPWAFLTCMALVPLRIVDHTGRVARDIIDAVEHCSHR